MPQMKINQRGLNVGMPQQMLQREKITPDSSACVAKLCRSV